MCEEVVDERICRLHEGASEATKHLVRLTSPLDVSRNNALRNKKKYKLILHPRLSKWNFKIDTHKLMADRAINELRNIGVV